MKTRFLILISICIILSPISWSQDNNHQFRTGFSYGLGTQQMFPYYSKDYLYNFNSFKALFNYTLKDGLFSFEIQAEPSLFISKHTLLNASFVQPDYGPNYLLLREIYTKEKTITEFALNIGIQVRFNPKGRFSYSFLVSSGPMFSDTDTERLAKGFAFSDVFAIGILYKINNLCFEFRPGVRHASNLDLKFPNSGHNSCTIDFGVSVEM